MLKVTIVAAGLPEFNVKQHHHRTSFIGKEGIPERQRVNQY